LPFITLFHKKLLFCKPKKELPLVAFFKQQKMQFFVK
jgi:hypothetical protein